MTQSNSNGRALEYIIVEILCSHLTKRGVSLTPRAIITQKRDSAKFNNLSKIESDEYIRYSELIFKWFDNKFDTHNANKILIDRIPDTEAVTGDVTDIRINVDDKIINLSIKHNHFALKHQRPPSLAIQCGFTKRSEEDISFRESLIKINNDFHSKRKVLAPSENVFNKLKTLDGDFIDNNLYKPTCIAVVDFINKHNTPFLSKTLFSFLVGNQNFYKIIASRKSIQIKEFADIVLPSKVEAKLVGKSYVKLIFSNKWIIDMRLHTASTLITSTPSLKFDTQAGEITIPETIMIDK